LIVRLLVEYAPKPDLAWQDGVVDPSFGASR
jgi:hypothetical protein